MAEEKIDKAIVSAASNTQMENLNLSKEELDLIKKSITNESSDKSYLYNLVKMYDKKNEKVDSEKEHGK